MENEQIVLILDQEPEMVSGLIDSLANILEVAGSSQELNLDTADYFWMGQLIKSSKNFMLKNGRKK